METLIQAIRTYKQEIGMEFNIEKFAMLIRKSGKRESAEGKELPNQENFRTLEEKENCKYLGSRHHQTIDESKKKREHLKNEKTSRN